MRYVRFADTDESVSVIGFGCWQMGRRMWTGVLDEDSVAAVHRALDLGVTLFDTADIYGFGHSETLLARALGSYCSKVFIATKGGVRYEPGRGFWRDTSAAWLKSACEASLRRLGRDYVDLYQVHWPSSETPLDETMEALIELKDQGKIRFIGVSNYFKDELEQLTRFGPVHALQPQLNIVKRRVINTSTLEFCSRNHIAVLAYGPLCEGLLTGRVGMDTKFEKGDNRSGHDEFEPPERRAANLQIVQVLLQIANERQRSAAQVAIRWVLAQPGVTTALCGTRTPAQIEDSAGAADWELSPSELDRIEQAVAKHRSDLFTR